MSILNIGAFGGGVASGGGIPSGGIIIWSGSEDDVPDGWHICDGTNGTPDLRGRFVLGANEDYSVGDEGGEEEVVLTADQMPRHYHSVSTLYGTGLALNTTNNSDPSTNSVPQTKSSSSNIHSSSVTASSRGNSEPHNNMPPYYALAYIMKL